MKLLEALRPTLRVVGSPESPNRERLKTAIAARDAAEQGVAERRTTLERMEATIKTSDAAARAAADAARKETEARNAWVRSGCTYSAARQLQSLSDEAAEAARTAERAAVDADAVSKQLARAQDAVSSARIEVGGCETKISAAIGVILAEEAAPLLDRFELVAEEYRNLRTKIMGVRLVLAQPWTLDNRNKMNPSWEGEQAITDALRRAEIKDWDEERQAVRDHDRLHGSGNGNDAALEQLMSPWRDRAEALRRDPDAE